MRPLAVRSLSSRIDQPVTMPSGHTLVFSLAGWEPVDQAAQEAFAALRNDPAGRIVYYATDYDQRRDFHVNSWPAVRAVIEDWLESGQCA